MPSFAWQKKTIYRVKSHKLLTTLLVNYFKTFIFKASYFVQMAKFFYRKVIKEKASVPDPDPTDPHVFGPPGSGSFYQQAKIVRKH